ncbi:MAG: Methyl-accepting chemotaxis protein 4 [Betaproteobacteria bacterium ADurb.Bin341]|nr:MAG: Methyl-accepting chemotaxis protein 4 [Betaproteobacteria bacterium ADurb.Bin341]
MHRDPRNWQFFLLRMAIPASIAIVFFVCLIQFFIIPTFERAMMNERREMIKQLTETAWSVLADFHNEQVAGRMTKLEAQKMARTAINSLRYGEEGKDYFWLLDEHPRMIAHPYRSDLEFRDVTDFKDPNGKRLFLEFANLVKEKKSGYVDYMWQWKNDPNKVVAKLSYVKGFEPWGWIVGTGIYIEDVHHDIQKLTDNILLVSIAIILIIGGIIVFVVLQGVGIERARQMAESNLVESKDKYQALVEASTDGLIMLLNNRDMIANKTLVSMLGYSDAEFKLLGLFDILATEDQGRENQGLKYVQALISGEKVPAQFEASLVKKDGQTLEVMMTASTIDFSGRPGIILIARDVSKFGQVERRRVEEERDALIAELQTSLHFLNHSIKELIHEAVSCSMQTSIRRATLLMDQKEASALLITAEDGQYIGIVTDHDIRKRAVSRQIDTDSPIVNIMTAPIITIPDRALVFEAALVMQDERIAYLAVEDAGGRIYGMINRADLVKIQGYSAVSLIQSIQRAETPGEIALRREKLPMRVKAVLDSGSRPQNVTRIISNLSDVIIRKLINLAISELGDPPANFAFVVLGSVGREEQTLCTDQDNAIIFDDGVPEDRLEETRNYFLAMSRKVCAWLDEIGYSYCQGNIMAQNPDWCQPLDTWKYYFSRWIHTAEPQDMLEVNIFFDFRCVFGDKTLVDQLRDHVDIAWQKHPLFIYLLAENALRYKPPLGVFGGIVTAAPGEPEGSFDIKAAMMPIVNIARAQALKHHISETNTMNRMRRLYEQKVFSEYEFSEIQLVYDFLMQLRLKHQAMEAKSGQTIDNFIHLKSMTHIEQMTLKNVFNKINDFLAKLRLDFTGMS